MINIVVCGSAGRMGRAILETLSGESDLGLGAALEKKGHPAVGQPVGKLIGVESWLSPVSDDTDTVFSGGDVAIDFTHPEGTLSHLRVATTLKKSMVIGTTGFTQEERGFIVQAAKTIPIVFSPNMSVGVNVIFRLLSDATRALGDAYDVEIVEIHHRHKKDAPSGTSLRMGEVVAEARKTTLSQVGRFAREGNIGARSAGEIGIQSMRGGDVIGDHTILFAGQGERIEITHRADSRKNFAHGAILAARWVVRQPPGLYTMMDVLGV
jgi:4-hydroxy-tetrahydrodipicolinate reductase